MDKDSDEEFFDAEMEKEWSEVTLPSPSMSVPGIGDEDPPDIEEDKDLEEEDDTSGIKQSPELSMCVDRAHPCVYSVMTIVPFFHRWCPSK